MKKGIMAGALVAAFALAVLTFAAYADINQNVSLLYGYNGSTFVPILTNASGGLQTDFNITTSTGISPKENNTNNIGATLAVWANLYARNIRSSTILSIFVSSTEAITILPNGTIGIGTATPNAQLTINGNISFTKGPKIINDNGKLKLQAGGPTNGTTSSIYFLDSTGTTRGRYETNYTPGSTTTVNITYPTAGTGADGNITINSGVTANCTTTAFAQGRTYADCFSTGLNSNASSSQRIVNVTNTTGLAVGDEIIIMQINGTGAGNYEFNNISAVTTTNITLQNNLTNNYTHDIVSRAQVVRVPQYTQVNISGNLTVSAWNGTTGGVLAFRANISVNITSTGIIDVSGKGFAGGAGGLKSAYAIRENGGCAGGENGWPGFNGTAGLGPSGTGGTGGTTGGTPGLYTTAVSGAGGGGAGCCGGGGAGGAYATANNGSVGGLGAGGTGGTYTGSGSGGAGGSGGSGAGGTHNALYGVANLSTMFFGSSGAGGAGGHGGAASHCTEGQSTVSSTGDAGGNGGNGGNGGGIIFIGTNNLSNTGFVRANGTAGTNGTDGEEGHGSSGGGGGAGAAASAGGGGAGGSILIRAANITAVGTITTGGGAGGVGGFGGRGGNGTNSGGGGGGGGAGTVGGPGGTPNAGGSPGGPGANATPGAGGAGGNGRIVCDTIVGSGCSTTPSANESMFSSTIITSTATTPISASSANSYGTLYIGSTNTAAADLAEYYVTGDSSIEAGDVVSLSNTKIISGSEEVVSRGVLRKSSGAYDGKLVGVISTAPGLILGSIDSYIHKDDRLLTLAGRTPVKVSSENGPIDIGGYLTSSSTPGVAMKATEPGMVIGRALEQFDGAGIGKIDVLIGAKEANIVDKARQQQLEIEELIEERAGLLVRLIALEAQMK